MMNILRQPPDQQISRTDYQAERDCRLQYDELCEGGDYYARLITNPLVEHSFAADYFVEVDKIILPPKSPQAPALSKLFATVTFTPIGQEGFTLSESEEDCKLDEEGLIHPISRILLRGSSAMPEGGYFISSFDDSELDQLDANIGTDLTNPSHA